MNKPLISLDTNVIILGLRQIDPYASLVLENLFHFNVRLCAQVERELQRNLTREEFRKFYDLLGLLTTMSIVYQPPDEQLLLLYQALGLKTGDAIIAAFCEQEQIDLFISENRHFLQELPNRSFQIIDSQTCCQRFALE